MAKVSRKVREYFRQGAEEVWVIVPEWPFVQVFRSINDVRTCGGGDAITSQLLPGWSLPVGELQPHELETEVDQA